MSTEQPMLLDMRKLQFTTILTSFQEETKNYKIDMNALKIFFFESLLKQHFVCHNFYIRWEYLFQTSRFNLYLM
jgi:hypothetical protein